MFLFALPNAILIAAAVIPAIWLLTYVYRSDRLEKEPLPFIGRLVFYGIFSTFLALITERIGGWILNMIFPKRTITYYILLYFGLVAFSEEGFKFLILYKKSWYSTAFNCQYDGVVYAVSVSMGFALWENISYVFHYGIGTALLRAVTAVPGHACFGVFMGIFYGLAKKYVNHGKETASRLFLILAVLAPALLHGAYDYIATVGHYYSTWAFVGFVAVLFAVSFLTIRNASRKDQYIG